MSIPPITAHKVLTGYARHTYLCQLCEKKCVLHLNYAPNDTPPDNISLSWPCGAKLKHKGERVSSKLERERNRERKKVTAGRKCD